MNKVLTQSSQILRHDDKSCESREWKDEESIFHLLAQLNISVISLLSSETKLEK